MVVEIQELTPPILIRDLALHTVSRDMKEPFTPEAFARYVRSEHSPIRAYSLLVTLRDVPPHVSTHFVRHKVGVEHFVSTSRPDRTGEPRSPDRLVHHIMLLNAQALINMARKRLCMKAEDETRVAMSMIKSRLSYMNEYTAVLSSFLVPECEYRGNQCHEFKSCGRCPNA